ncbi:MAG: hypothetical protein U0K18_01240 [Acutalibacteraceae bacterium]|nr:hypothetical protein [Clostridia bacterium]MEE1329816.1 hypothetical protein [Acutalibacteraceae bacterium]
MSWLNSFLTSVCAALVLIGALYLITPDGSMGKPVRYVLSLCFLAVIVAFAPFNAAKLDFEFEKQACESQTETDLITDAAVYVYTQALKNSGINFNKITVCTDKTENGSISITKILIYSNEPDYKIRDALADAAKNYEVVVINE